MLLRFFTLTNNVKNPTILQNPSYRGTTLLSKDPGYGHFCDHRRAGLRHPRCSTSGSTMSLAVLRIRIRAILQDKDPTYYCIIPTIRHIYDTCCFWSLACSESIGPSPLIQLPVPRRMEQIKKPTTFTTVNSCQPRRFLRRQLHKMAAGYTRLTVPSPTQLHPGDHYSGIKNVLPAPLQSRPRAAIATLFIIQVSRLQLLECLLQHTCQHGARSASLPCR